MADSDDFVDLVTNICERPTMYTLTSTYVEIVAYIIGYRHAQKYPREEHDALNAFVTSKFGVPSKLAWSSAIHIASVNDAAAISALRTTLIEYTDLRKTKTPEEIQAIAADKNARHVDSEPAKVWRRFLAARYTADRAAIEPLILPHGKADALWGHSATPSGVAAQLSEISNSYCISIISGSIESGHVQLATELGIIDAHLVESSWRIDASALIEFTASRDE